MSTARRAYDILRGYVNHGWDQIQGGQESDAERELREAVERPYSPPAPQTDDQPRPRTMSTAVSLETARRLLDVGPDATSKQISAAHQNIRKAVDPTRFPAGSDARARADHLLRLIDASQRVLTENVDPTIRRFEGLEIE